MIQQVFGGTGFLACAGISHSLERLCHQSEKLLDKDKLWGVWERACKWPSATGPLSQRLSLDYSGSQVQLGNQVLFGIRGRFLAPLRSPPPPDQPLDLRFCGLRFFCPAAGAALSGGVAEGSGVCGPLPGLPGRAPRPDRTFRHRALPQGNHPAAPGPGGDHPALRALRHQRGGFPGASGPGPHPRRHPGDLPHDLLVSRGGRGHPPGPGALPRRSGHPGRDLRHPVPGARPKTQRRRPGGGRAGRSGHFGYPGGGHRFCAAGANMPRPGRFGLPALSGPGPPGPPVLYPHPHLPGLPPGLHLLRLPAAPAHLPAAAAPGGGGRADLLAGPIGPGGRRLLRRRPAAGARPTTSW